MEPSNVTTWIGQTPHGVVVARVGAGQVLVDGPSLRSFHKPVSATTGAQGLVVDGTDLRPVAPLPARLCRLAGWYAGDGRGILLTQIPEADFGEPMILVAEDDRVTRAYALTERRLLTEDGATIDLTDEGELRISSGGQIAMLSRSSRYREQEVDFLVDGVRLAGTLVIPPGPGPHPAVVLLHGAAGGQRDFCRLHADPILAAGVAVLIYDKAGHGRSGGDEPSVFSQADAAEAAMRTLAALPEVDAGRIGLAGFSNGMWAGPMAAARRGAAFLAGVGSPGVSMAEAEVHRRTQVLRDADVGPATVAAAGDAWRCIFTIAGEGPSPAVLQRLGQALDTVRAATDLDRYELPDFVRLNPMLSPIPPLIPVAELVAMLGKELNPELTHDPAADYARIDCPVFLQYGSHDTSVPVQVSVERIKHAMTGTEPAPTIRVYPGLEHMLNVLPTDLTGLTPEAATYQYHHFRYGQDARADLTAWLRGLVTAPPAAWNRPASTAAPGPRK